MGISLGYLGLVVVRVSLVEICVRFVLGVVLGFQLKLWMNVVKMLRMMI